MSYEQRKINRQNRQQRERRYKRLIIGIGILLMIIIISSLINKKAKTILAVEDIYLKEIELEGVIIKDEKVFKLDEIKEIDTEKLEGKRIPAGIKVGNATVLNDLDLLKKDLKEVEAAITTLKKTGNDKVFKNDKKVLLENYNENIEKIQKDINDENYKNIKETKEEIVSTQQDINDLFPENPLLGKDIDALNDIKENLKSDIGQKGASYISERSGILSYEIDGYENKFKAEAFDNYTYDKLIIPNKKELSQIKEKNDIKGFKIIDNFEWYLALKIDDRKKIDKYEIGDKVFVNYPLKDNYIEISGNVIAINNSSNKSVIIIKSNKNLHDLYMDRFTKVNLIQEKLDILKIPDNIIIDKDGVKGVYIKDFSGIVKFKPIKIITNIDGFAYVDKGENSMISIKENKKEFETISIYDEILLKPNKFKEGEIID